MRHGFVSLAKEVSSTLIVSLESEEVLFIELELACYSQLVLS